MKLVDGVHIQGRGKQIKESRTCMWGLTWMPIKAKEIYMYICDHKGGLFRLLVLHQQLYVLICDGMKKRKKKVKFKL